MLSIQKYPEGIMTTIVDADGKHVQRPDPRAGKYVARWVVDGEAGPELVLSDATQAALAADEVRAQGEADDAAAGALAAKLAAVNARRSAR